MGPSTGPPPGPTRRMAPMRLSDRKSKAVQYQALAQAPRPDRRMATMCEWAQNCVGSEGKFATLNTEYFKAGCGVFLSKDILRPFKNNYGCYVANASQA